MTAEGGHTCARVARRPGAAGRQTRTGICRYIVGGCAAACLLVIVAVVGANRCTIGSVARAGAVTDGAVLADVLADRLGPSNLGYPSRVIGVSETGDGALAVSLWAQRAPTREAMETIVLADVWAVLQLAFRFGGPPPRVGVTVFYPVETVQGSVEVRVVGHVRMSWNAFSRIDLESFSVDELASVAETAIVSTAVLE